VALGQRRATAVRDYIVTTGIAAGRLDVRDGGADEPVDTNKTKPGRAKNRRIEFTILTDGTVWASPMFSAPKPAEASPHTGTFAEVMAAIIKDPGEAVVLATAWTDREPGDVLAVIGLGDALAAAGDRRAAARAYGSIIDFPRRAPTCAGTRGSAWPRSARSGSRWRSTRTRRPARQRPDHPTGHRLYAHALASAGRHREAFAAIVAGLREGQSRARSGVDAVLRADAAVLAAAYVARSPERRPEVETELVKWGVSLPRTPSTSFVLTWETDANDVDLHVYDGATGHASYASRHMPSGGALVADVTNGYGPEMFSIEGTPAAYPYRLEAHYFGQGPMGYGMGTLQVVEHDGEGRLRVDERPFVIMNTGARVQLGKLAAPAK
jgi:hypothetical protein